MAAFFNAVSAVVVLLLLMSVGYLMGRGGWMGAGEKKFLSKYIVNIAVPCNCMVGILNNLDRDTVGQAALMVVDANEGVMENSKRHGYLLSMLGVKQIAVLINKMDAVGYSKERFDDIKTEYGAFLHGIHAPQARS